MEKFGIFELLDALSQITAGTDGQNPPSAPEKDDAAFAPPAYTQDKNAPDTPKQQTADSDPLPRQNDPSKAFEEFLSRHNPISEKIDKK